MKETRSITFRMGEDLLKALKVQAAMNGRSANSECAAILKVALFTTKKALEANQSNPSASNQ